MAGRRTKPNSEPASPNGTSTRGHNGKRKITLVLPEPLDTAVETYCLVTGTPKNEAAARAFREFIKKHERDTLRRLSDLRANTSAAAAGI